MALRLARRTPGADAPGSPHTEKPERQRMKTSAVCFPFDLFGSSGAGAGAELLADELREILADNRRETVATRARAYTEHVRLRETTFPTLEALGAWRRQGRKLARQAIRQGDFLLWLAGNH